MSILAAARTATNRRSNWPAKRVRHSCRFPCICPGRDQTSRWTGRLSTNSAKPYCRPIRRPFSCRGFPATRRPGGVRPIPRTTWSGTAARGGAIRSWLHPPIDAMPRSVSRRSCHAFGGEIRGEHGWLPSLRTEHGRVVLPGNVERATQWLCRRRSTELGAVGCRTATRRRRFASRMARSAK